MNEMKKLMETIESISEGYYDDDPVDISELKGKTLVDIDVGNGKEQINFKTTDGEIYEMYHVGDCCESVYLEDVVGDLSDLVGSQIIEAEEVVSTDENPPDRLKTDEEDRDYYGEYMVESYTWTFYKLGTMRGHVTLRWFGQSNGYYSERVSIFKKTTNNEDTRSKGISEVAVARNDPEMDDYNDARKEKEQDMNDAPYYVEWNAQSWEWYGDDDPSTGKGRYKPKGDGGRIVAINVPTYEKAMEIANKLDASYDDGNFEDKNVYGSQGDSGYVLDYHGSNIRSMAKMDEFDKETITNAHPRFKPADYEGTRG